MEPYGRSRAPAEGSPPEPAPDWNSPTPETGLEESMWQLGLGGGRGSGGDVSYPERPGEPDCIYYLRTGFCGYGTGCRFNHPRDRTSIAGVVGSGGGVYPVRIGQPVCQYFLKTGTCKYGATCKYHHPRHEASAVSLNYHGYPLRPGEKECSYYVKTGHCKFGVTCKFHHPQPAGISLSQSAPTFYPAVQSHAIPSPSQYGVASWQVARPPPVPASYVQGPYGPMLLTQAVVPLSGWSPYSPPVSPIVHPGTPQTVGTGRTYGPTPQLSPSAPAYEGPYSSFSSIAGPSSSPKEQMFPQRPGQPECQFYMRTGDCKYGSSCRYHHPPEWSMPKSNCVLSPMGLPLRPGAPLCSFYAQNGVCKFGPTCKFDHPMGTLSYSPSASSLADMPVAPYPIGLSLGTLAPSSTSELRREFVSGSTKDSSARMPSTENSSSGSVGSLFSRAGASVPQLHIQISSHSSAPSSGNSSMGHGGDS